MNRDIKFRAWDVRNNKYYHMSNGDFIIDYEGVSLLSEYGGLINKSWKLEQFTGLHAKSGKEIYENDLLVFEYDDLRGCSLPYIVMMKHGAWKMQHGIKDEYIYHHLDKIKIVGNIHENPELLEESE